MPASVRSSLSTSILAVSVALTFAGACDDDKTATSYVTYDSFSAQVTAGQTLYGANCASCHGEMGQGTEDGPRVVDLSMGALPLEPPADRQVRTSRFVTVADVATFAAANMPPGKAGSLTAEQYWAVLAFDLHANGIDLQMKLTPELAATLTIPR